MTPLSPEGAEELRRQLAAMLFFALPPADATEAQRIEAWQRRVKGLLECLDILDGTAEREHEVCEGCAQKIYPDDPRFNCEDGPVLCPACTPEPFHAAEFGYTALEADQDIARARMFATEMKLADDASDDPDPQPGLRVVQ